MFLIAVFAANTLWTVRTSQGFDALCALNVLSGDPYYIAQYPQDTAMFGAPRYAPARAAAERLRVALKDRRGMIISAFLTLVFSGGPDSTLDAVVESARDPRQLEERFRSSPFWSQDSWNVFAEIRPDVLAALQSMREAGFADDWRRSFAGNPSADVEALKTELAKYDVSAEQARLVGPTFRRERIEIILLRFSRPHGIRIQGDRFLTDIGYPPAVVLRNAAHEPLHAAIDSSTLSKLVAHLAADSLVTAIVAKHNRSFGYNSLPGYVEEDVTQALEQVVSDRLGFSTPAAARWRSGDDGMHLLAAALYDLMRESGFVASGGTFSSWLDVQLAQGHLAPTEFARHARRVVGDDVIAKWR